MSCVGMRWATPHRKCRVMDFVKPLYFDVCAVRFSICEYEDIFFSWIFCFPFSFFAFSKFVWARSAVKQKMSACMPLCRRYVVARIRTRLYWCQVPCNFCVSHVSHTCLMRGAWCKIPRVSHVSCLVPCDCCVYVAYQVH